MLYSNVALFAFNLTCFGIVHFMYRIHLLFAIIAYFFDHVRDAFPNCICVLSVFLFSGKPIFSVDIHPDGTKFATGGQGENLNPLTSLSFFC